MNENKRSSFLVNLALKNTNSDTSGGRQTSTPVVCDSITNLKKRRSRSISANFQHAPETNSGSGIITAQNYHPRTKKARSTSTDVKSEIMTKFLSATHHDSEVNILTYQSSHKQRARVLSTHFEYHDSTVHEPLVLSPRPINRLHNEDFTSYDLNKSSGLESRHSINIPLCNKNSIITQLEKSAIQFTSSSGPFKTWVSTTGKYNKKILMEDIEKKENIIPETITMFGESAINNESPRKVTSKILATDFECQPSSSSNSDELFTEKFLSQLNEKEKPPRRQVRTRGGISRQAAPNKKNNTNIEDQLIEIVGSTSVNEMPSTSIPKDDKPISDEQLLKILEEPEENLDEYIFDNDLLNNISEFNPDSDPDSDSTIDNEELVPNSEEDQEWSNEKRQNEKFCFEGPPVGLNIQPEGSEPIDYFNLIVTEECLLMIINKSNENASRILGQSLPSSRIKHWKDITLPEFKIFLGLLYHMGTIKLNRIQDYWKKHRLFNLTCFSNYMSRNRFLLILRVLHFEDNDAEDTRLVKISPLVTYFNNRMREVYYPSNSLCIDESLVLWRGRLIFRQYIKNKSHKYGIKLYIMTDINGIILKIIVYAGAGDTAVGGTNHAAKVVTNLLQDYFNKGFSVYMDNFYNSVELAETLLSVNTYCTGTLRQNRKNNPKEVVTKKLKKGEFIAQYNKKGICVMKWRDNRDVLLISSEYDAQMTTTTTRRKTEVVKPNIVINYNKNMGAVDHQDQMLAYYSCEHKTIRWYKKLGIHLLQQMLYNSFTIYNLLSGAPKKPYYDFRLSVIENLTPDTNDVAARPASKVHVIQPCPRKGKSMRRRCKVCWDTEKKRKDTPYYCPDCDEQPGLCIINCFKLYHGY